MNSLKANNYDFDALEVRKSALQAIEVEWSAIQIKIESLEISDEIEQTQVRVTFEDDYYTCAVLHPSNF